MDSAHPHSALIADLGRSLEQLELGIVLRSEAGERIVRKLMEARERAPFAKQPEPWWLRIVLSAIMDPDPWLYGFVDQCFEPAAPPTRVELHALPGWGQARVDHVAARWLATSVLIPPNADVLLGLASIAVLGAEVMDVVHEPPASIALRPHGATSSEPSTVFVQVEEKSLLLTAHTESALREVSRSIFRPLEPDTERLATAVEMLVDASLSAVQVALTRRRGWRHKHPSFGSSPLPALQVLRRAPAHLVATRAWVAEGVVSAGRSAIDSVCDEVLRLDPTASSPVVGSSTELWEADTAVRDIVRRWALDRPTLAERMADQIDHERRQDEEWAAWVDRSRSHDAQAPASETEPSHGGGKIE